MTAREVDTDLFSDRPQHQPSAEVDLAGETVERWALDYIRAESLAHKIAPPTPPTIWGQPTSQVLLPVAGLKEIRPGRPPHWTLIQKAEKTPGLSTPRGRAHLLHTFFHHELQAAELMLWALLVFPESPTAFRGGLLRIALDEIRHMNLYAEHIRHLGFEVGDFPVRDWFWQRVPACVDPIAFVAVMGLGFESANLEHTANFASRFRQVGDEKGAQVQELVGREELAHVRFGAKWFATWTGGLDFDQWQQALPKPLSPMLMAGRPLQRAARQLAGIPEAFLDRLEAFEPTPHEPRG